MDQLTSTNQMRAAAGLPPLDSLPVNLERTGRKIDAADQRHRLHRVQRLRLDLPLDERFTFAMNTPTLDEDHRREIVASCGRSLEGDQLDTDVQNEMMAMAGGTLSLSLDAAKGKKIMEASQELADAKLAAGGGDLGPEFKERLAAAIREETARVHAENPLIVSDEDIRDLARRVVEKATAKAREKIESTLSLSTIPCPVALAEADQRLDQSIQDEMATAAGGSSLSSSLHKEMAAVAAE